MYNKIKGIASFRWLASFLCLAVFLCLGANDVFAHVGSGGNCAGCHDPATNKMNISGNTGTLAVNPRQDAGTIAPLKYFTIPQGGSVPMTINVTDGGVNNDLFVTALTGTIKGSTLESLTSTTIKGVQTSAADILALTPDASWTPRSPSSGTYFTQGPLTWAGTPVSKIYTLKISDTTPLDVYTMTFRATGVDSNIGMWTQSEEFLVKVVAPVAEPATGVTLLTTCLALVCGTWWRRRKVS